MRDVVIGIREAEGRDDKRGFEALDRARELGADDVGRDGRVTGVVSVLHELEVRRRGVEQRERSTILVATHLHDVVARVEATLHVPEPHRIGIARRVAREHCDRHDIRDARP